MQVSDYSLVSQLLVKAAEDYSKENQTDMTEVMQNVGVNNASLFGISMLVPEKKGEALALSLYSGFISSPVLPEFTADEKKKISASLSYNKPTSDDTTSLTIEVVRQIANEWLEKEKKKSSEAEEKSSASQAQNEVSKACLSSCDKTAAGPDAASSGEIEALKAKHREEKALAETAHSQQMQRSIHKVAELEKEVHVLGTENDVLNRKLEQNAHLIKDLNSQIKELKSQVEILKGQRAYKYVVKSGSR